MATVNKRIYKPQAMVINGVNQGGLMQARIQEGYDTILRSSPDGLQVPLVDKYTAFCRGSITSQDWVEAYNLLTGTLGTLVFYERKSAVAEATGYIKHTITNPVIHRISFSLNKDGYATVTFDFECKAADEAKTFTDMHAPTDSQNVPTYVTAARGGMRVISTLHAALAVYHVTAFTFNMALKLVKDSNDGDLGYTVVDALLDGLACDGSITFQDGSISTAKLLAQQLMAAARGSLVLTVRQGSAAANQVITIAGVDFTTIGVDSDADADFNSHTANFIISNDTTTQLTLAGVNKILAIAAAA